MVRMGYQNCISCHISPTGGGVLTPYGRGMSSEILSTWHYEGEDAIDHGLFRSQDGSALTTPTWLAIGGDSRWIQSYINNLQATQTQFFPMQNQLEAAVHIGRATFVGNLNYEGGPPGTPNYGSINSERLYAMYNFTDEIYARAGKYMVPFGINQPNHTAVIQQNLGFAVETESDNLEVGYLGEKFNAILTADFGRPDNTSIVQETGASLNLAYNLFESHKLGWSFFSGNSLSSTRFLNGPYAILGFWKKLVLLSQFDFQWLDNKNPLGGPEQKGFVTFNRLQYEVIKGIHPYLLHQISYLNSSTISSRYDTYGGGIIFYPRPHFEFWAEWDKVRDENVADLYTDAAWLILHYYL